MAPSPNHHPAELAALLADLTTAAATALHELTLAGGPVTLRLSSTEQAPLATLARAFTPYLTADGPACAGVAERVYLSSDPGLVTRLRLASTAAPDATWPACPGGVRLVHTTAEWNDQRRGAFLLWGSSAPRTSYVVLDGTGPVADRLALRLVRGIASRMLTTCGWTPLHAAAAATPTGLIVLIGPSGSGKTTALLHLLAHGGGRALVANDKVYLGFTGRLHARGLPTSVAVRHDTVEMFPQLAVLARRGTNLHAANAPGAERRDLRVLIPPSRLAEVFGVPLVAGGPVAGLIAMGHHAPGSRSRWRRLAPRQAEKVAANAYLEDWFVDEPQEYARLGDAADILPDIHLLSLSRAAVSVPFVELSSGSAVRDALESAVAGLTTGMAQAEREDLL